MVAAQGRLQAIDIDTSVCRLWEHGAFRLLVKNEAVKAAPSLKHETHSRAAAGAANRTTKIPVIFSINSNINEC